MVLDQIIAAKKEFIAGLSHHDTLKQNQTKGGRGDLFLKAIQTRPRNLIAELKSKSPSEGIIKPDYDPVALAKEYVKGGAAAISVLTDTPFFGGSFAHLKSVREAVDLPLLCKDFILDEKQVFLAREHGADAVLLIVRILTPQALRHLKAVIESLNMLAVIEVFDEKDLTLALTVSPQVLMVNNRNLDSLAMNLNNTASLLDQIPAGIPVIAASGIKAPQDVEALPGRICAMLVGTLLMRWPRSAHVIEALTGAHPRLKLCGMTNARDVLFCDRLRVDFQGFIFYPPSPRSVTREVAKPIIEGLQYSRAVGVFVGTPIAEIIEIAEDLKLWGVQVYEDHDFGSVPFQVIRALSVKKTDGRVLPSHHERADFLLLDTHDPNQRGGTGKQFDWERLPQNLSRVFLAGGIHAGNIEEALAYLPFAIDLVSGVETAPGKKDLKKIEEIYECLLRSIWRGLRR